MRISIEKRIVRRVADDLLAIYRESFAHLETLAAGRQTLDESDFRDQLSDETVLKFVGWDRKGHPTAFALVATDLSRIPWISPPYFAHRFPEQFERGAIYYVDAIAVPPCQRGGIWAYALLKSLVRMVAENRGIAAFDCCQFNEETVDVPKMVAAVGERFCHFEPHHLDTQRYYAYVASGLRVEERDEVEVTDQLSRSKEDVAIDLVALETAERERATKSQHEESVREL